MRSKIKKILKCLLIHWFCCWLPFNSYAADSDYITPWFDLSKSSHNAWTISGLLHNEQDDYYGFIMILERHGQAFHAFAGLFDLNEKKLIWQDSNTQFLDNNTPLTQAIGHFYWHFSPINNTFILAYQDKNSKNQIFNLKMDLMQPIVVTPKMSLTPTLKIKQYWSGTINGHIHTPDEQFVTSGSVWVQNIWQNQNDNQTHPFSELLCQFQDGSTMFAIQVPEKTGLHAALAGLYDKDGQRQTVSQFINLNPPNQQDYEISLHAHDQNLHLHQLFSNQHYTALLAHMGAISQSGFCLYANQPWEQSNSPHLRLPLPSQMNVLNFFEKNFALKQKTFKIPFIMKNKESS